MLAAVVPLKDQQILVNSVITFLVIIRTNLDLQLSCREAKFFSRNLLTAARQAVRLN